MKKIRSTTLAEDTEPYFCCRNTAFVNKENQTQFLSGVDKSHLFLCTKPQARKKQNNIFLWKKNQHQAQFLGTKSISTFFFFGEKVKAPAEEKKFFFKRNRIIMFFFLQQPTANYYVISVFAKRLAKIALILGTQVKFFLCVLCKFYNKSLHKSLHAYF